MVNSNLNVNSVAYQLVAALTRRGSTTFFGIPGGPVCPVFEAIRLIPDTTLIESRQETHAAFSAAAFWTTTQKIPVVVVTAGPGLTNVITGVASAHLERVPMLVIVGDVAGSGAVLAQDCGPTGLNAEALLRPITRAQFRLRTPQHVVPYLLKAFEALTHPTNPGPVALVLPIDLARAELNVFDTWVDPLPTPKTPDSPHHDIEIVGEWLQQATRPLFVLGAGCRGHKDEIRSLVDAWPVPFVTTPRAKGVVSERHPRSLRNGGIAASLWARRYITPGVDVCVVLGSDLDDSTIGPTSYVKPGGKLVHVDLDPSVFGRNLPTTLALGMDLVQFSRTLVTVAGQVSPAATQARKEAKAEPPFDASAHHLDDSTPISPHRLIADLQRAAPENAAYITDIGEHMLFAMHYIVAEPKGFHIQFNLGSMASGIAGAIGLAIGDPSRPVICLAGDGGMHMAGMEILVALKNKLKILYVVFNDSRYNMVHHGMAQIFGEADQYDMPPVDFAAWASSMKIPSVVVSRSGEITPKLVRELLSGEGPAVIDARINPATRIRGGGRVEALQQMSMRV